MNGGVCIRGSCLAEASLLRQVTSPAPSAAPDPVTGGDLPIVLVPVGLEAMEGRYSPRAWQPPVKLLGGAAGAYWVLGHLWVFPSVCHFERFKRKCCDWQPSC